MSSVKSNLQKPLAALAALMVAQSALAADGLVDSASFETGGGTEVRMVRVGLQSDWSHQWFKSNGTHLSGYWDLSLAQWREKAFRNVPGQHRNITDLGLTPVLRFQNDNKKGWYAEGGIGLNLLSERYDNAGNQLSTRFQFGDHIGAGYVFDNKLEIGVRVQHFSNGGYKKPNSGVNFMMVKAARQF